MKERGREGERKIERDRGEGGDYKYFRMMVRYNHQDSHNHFCYPMLTGEGYLWPGGKGGC